MLDLNPHPYDSVEAHEFERDMARRNLEMVAEAAAKRIQAAAEAPANREDGKKSEAFYETVIAVSEMVVTANQQYKYEKLTVEKKKAATQTEGN